MKTAVVLFGLAALVGGGWPARADAPAPSGTALPEGAAMRRELHAGRERLAVLVDTASGGKSRLMLETAKSANPSGYPVRAVGWGGLPFAEVCPVSEPFMAKLGDRGEGTVMGALTLLEIGEGENGPGVYLLFRPFKASANAKDGSNALQLLRVTVEETGRVRYAVHAEAKRLDKPFSTEGEMPVADVVFDGLDLAIRLRWDAETWHFEFRPAIIFV